MKVRWVNHLHHLREIITYITESTGNGASHREPTYRCCLPALAGFTSLLPRSSRLCSLAFLGLPKVGKE
jgi:hypothetical protein